MSHLRPALVLLALFTALTGLLYPLAMTEVGQALFPAAANGSVIRNASGTIIGSTLIGQNFTAERYLWPRPSATSGADPNDPSKTIDQPYNASSSTGSNLGPISQKLADRIGATVKQLRATGITGEIPADAVTTSASGLDPDISPAFARLQIPRIAKARGLSEDKVAAALDQATKGRDLGILGEPRVNVLIANLALDGLKP